MKAKILTIIIISILLCSCTELPNLNWEAASESLERTNDRLAMIYMAEKGLLYPYWLYPFSMYNMDYMRIDMDMLMMEMSSLKMQLMLNQSSKHSTTPTSPFTVIAKVVENTGTNISIELSNSFILKLRKVQYFNFPVVKGDIVYLITPNSDIFLSDGIRTVKFVLDY